MKAVIFDLDGTLVDSAPDIHAASEAMLRAMGREILPYERVRRFIGNGVPKLVERCIDASGGGDEEDRRAALASFNRAYRAAPCALTRPYDGVAALLPRLRDAGFALGVCTNKPAGLTAAVLETLGWTDLFGAVLGGDSLPQMKPDPTPLRRAAAMLEAPPEATLYVGDSETDEATAVAAALPFLLFTGGYRKKPAEAFETAFAFDHFDQLAERLLSAQASA